MIGGHSETRHVERYISALVLALGLIVSAGGAWFAHRSAAAERQQQFDGLAEDARTTIERRVAAYTEVLYGLRSLHSAQRPVTRTAFLRYLRSADVGSRNGAGLSISFDRMVPRDEVAQFERAVRSDGGIDRSGYTNFRVLPETGEDPLYVVEHIEPLEGNESVLGFDIGSDPVRRAAIEAARDQGTPVATTPIELVQTRGGRGFLLFLAVYDREEVPQTGPARRRSFAGAMTAVFSVDDMMEGVLGAEPAVDIEIFDIGVTIEPEVVALGRDRVLYDGDEHLGALDVSSAPTPNRFLDLNVAERRWRIFATPGSRFAQGTGFVVPAAVGGFGLALTLLIAGALFSFSRSRRAAVRLATDMTANLRAREAELKEANEGLDEVNTELIAVNATMRDFVSTAAHDLKNPLTAILGFAELLGGGWEEFPDDQKKEFVEAIVRQGGHLSRLVDDLLTLSRIEGGVLEAHPATIDVHSCVDGVLELFAQDRSKITLDVPDGLFITADIEHVRRILSNYLGNALKYGLPPISVSASDAGESIEIRVRDAGKGVPADFVPRLFGRFARADTEQTREVKGTGLGLSIVRGLARGNGGDAWYEEVENGASFVVAFPTASLVAQ